MSIVLSLLMNNLTIRCNDKLLIMYISNVERNGLGVFTFVEYIS